MTHEIFISHASADKEIADAMTAALEGAGLQCWIAPRNIRPGDTWGGSIVRAIESSKMMVIIFSENSNASRQVLREVERAVQKDVVLMPFRIDEDTPTGDMEYFLSATHWLDALTPNLDGHLRKLVRISNSILEKPTSSIGENTGSRGSSVKNVESRTGVSSTIPKSLHPTSNAFASNLNSNTSAKTDGAQSVESTNRTENTNKAESADITNKVKNKQITQTGHTAELKLEARRAPPGTKTKHSQAAKSKKVEVNNNNQNTNDLSVNTNKSAGEKNKSINLLLLPALILVAIIVWFLVQKTDFFGNEEVETALFIDTPMSAEPTTGQPTSVDVTESLAVPKSDYGDQDVQAAQRTETEAETAIVNREVATAESASADDVYPDKNLATQAQDNSDQGASEQSDSEEDSADNSSQVNEATVAPGIVKPKIDVISPLLARANDGDIGAILELSERYLDGRGVDRDQLESVRLLEIAANNGSAPAQNKLANYYANGKIVPRDDEQALIWYTLAAQQGDINAQYSLGEIYEFGFGAEANLSEAKKWYGQAAAQGHTKAAIFLKKFQEKSAAQGELESLLQATDPIENE
ncbi:MAG: hypothetical protein ACI9XU_000691 [Arenicella sp.]|jgi:hypothetical protein